MINQLRSITLTEMTVVRETAQQIMGRLTVGRALDSGRTLDMT